MRISKSLPFAAVMVLGCGSSDPSGPQSSGPPPTPVATNAVDINDNFFSPQIASVGGQTTVTWIWNGSGGHNVTFEDGEGSSSTKTTGTHQRTFSGGGTFRYRCTIHSANFANGMIGSVVVQ
jgi:plastocyanin